MPKKLDLTGQKFNKLTVVKETSRRDSRGSVIWECLCDCGNITEANSSDLRRGHKQSCGCLVKDTARNIGKANLIDLTGQKFGLLTVLERGQNNVDRKACWICKCECGTIIEISGTQLRKGVQSCGCIKSLGELKIASLLNEAKIPYEKEKIFTNFISTRGGFPRFDFFVNNQYIIEYDGKQHFQNSSWGSELNTKENQQKKDLEKNQFCFNANIPIIRIPYTHYLNLELKDILLETSTFILKKGDNINDSNQ